MSRIVIVIEFYLFIMPADSTEVSVITVELLTGLCSRAVFHCRWFRADIERSTHSSDRHLFSSLRCRPRRRRSHC
jgi:hypothetical protein